MPRLSTETFGTGDPTWLDSTHGLYECRSVNLDLSAFTEGTHYPDGFLLSGTPLAEITSSGLYGPYGANAEEVQTITVDATGGTLTITFDGETTAAISATAAASAVQTAMEALSNINPGDVAVTGGPGDDGGTTPYVFTFGGQYVGTNVPAMTTAAGSLTGGAGTAVVATDTGGGSAASNGLETFVGFLKVDVPTDGVEDVNAPIFEHGRVRETNLPIAIDAAAKAANPRIAYV